MVTNYSPGALTLISMNGTAMAVDSCTLGMKQQMLERNGIRGTRQHFDTDKRLGPKRIGGTIRTEPSYSELVALMTLAIGSGGNCADSIPSFNCVVNRYEQTYTYTGCKIGRATITGQQGGIISVSLDLVGQTEVANTGTVSTPNSGIPFIMADLVLTLLNTGQETHSFTLVIDNHLDAERFLNSLTLSQVVELDRTVTLQSQHPFNDTTLSLYNQAVGGNTGTLALNNGTNTATFTFGRLQVPPENVDIPGKTELMLVLNMLASKVSGSAANTTDQIAFS